VKNPEHRALLQTLRRALPERVFAPQPWRGALAVAVVLINAMLTLALGWSRWPWWIALPLAIALGLTIVTQGFLGHEILHGAVTRVRWWETALGFLCFGPAGITPALWRAWHLRVHHAHANQPGRDSDSIGRIGDVRGTLMASVDRITAGSSWLGVCFFPVYFVLQGQLMLWHHADRALFAEARFDPWPSRLFVALVVGAYGVAAAHFGVTGTFLAIVLPWSVANATFMAYIATNHWLDPIDDADNDPFLNATSVTTWRWLDWLHGNFSHHQEHHLFPAMSPIFAPAVRDTLRRLAPERSRHVPHARALAAIFATPRAYAAEDVLGSIDGRRRVALSELRRSLDR
jgi:fatty acid desaturase